MSIFSATLLIGLTVMQPREKRAQVFFGCLVAGLVIHFLFPLVR
jgi:hypothetical protein